MRRPNQDLDSADEYPYNVIDGTHELNSPNRDGQKKAETAFRDGRSLEIDKASKVSQTNGKAHA